MAWTVTQVPFLPKACSRPNHSDLQLPSVCPLAARNPMLSAKMTFCRILVLVQIIFAQTPPAIVNTPTLIAFAVFY